MMRLRIQTYNPLPEIKAWFIPDIQSAASVYDLKEALCLRFQALKARKFSGKDLILLLDDFELLNDSPFSAVRDGDLICVKLSPVEDIKQLDVYELNMTRQRKRKRSQSTSLPIPSRFVREPSVLPYSKQKATQPSEGNDSESSDSESDTSSSTSSSYSSSSLSSGTSSISAPKLLSSQPTPQAKETKQPKNTTLSNSASQPIPLVPPGFGKPSTHSRNKRRRLKKGYEKDDSTTLLASTPGPPKGSSLTNNLPLGQRKSKPGPSSHPPSHTNTLLSSKSPPASAPINASEMNAQGGDISTFSFSSMLPEHSRHENNSDSYTTPRNEVMMGSLRNKNKKKGFKQSMANPLPQKIIFTTNTTASGSQQPSLSAQKDMLMDGEPPTSSGVTTIQPRLIPPSEIQELGQLPSNMFVTSVDVESGMWDEEHLPSHKKQGKKKQKTDRHNSSQNLTYENGQFDDAHDDSSLTLPYFDNTDVQTSATQASSDTTLGTTSTPLDWDRVERLWEECAVLEKLEQLAVGCLVGWKDLAINPQTFSPEMLLMVARVVSIGQEESTSISTSKSTQSIVIRYLQRPGAGRAALAFGLNGAARFNDEEEQVEDEDVDEAFEWTDVLTRQWRVLKL